MGETGTGFAPTRGIQRSVAHRQRRAPRPSCFFFLSAYDRARVIKPSFTASDADGRLLPKTKWPHAIPLSRRSLLRHTRQTHQHDFPAADSDEILLNLHHSLHHHRAKLEAGAGRAVPVGLYLRERRFGEHALRLDGVARHGHGLVQGACRGLRSEGEEVSETALGNVRKCAWRITTDGTRAQSGAGLCTCRVV